ncbi:hypothetical protein [Streptodolium elevatio]
MGGPATIDELMRGCRRTAVHLEMRDAYMWPLETFFMFDSEQVNVELVSAHLTITQPHEVRMYEHTFAALADLAVYGAEARALITAAIAALG